jgi:hypothetical protein
MENRKACCGIPLTISVPGSVGQGALSDSFHM